MDMYSKALRGYLSKWFTIAPLKGANRANVYIRILRLAKVARSIVAGRRTTFDSPVGAVRRSCKVQLMRPVPTISLSLSLVPHIHATGSNKMSPQDFALGQQSSAGITRAAQSGSLIPK